MTPIVIQGTVQPDGSLQLAQKLPLPAGPVQVTIQSLPTFPANDPFLKMLKGIWADRAAAGLTPRTAEEVEADRRAFRAEVDREIEATGQLQGENPQRS